MPLRPLAGAGNARVKHLIGIGVTVEVTGPRGGERGEQSLDAGNPGA
jgi:hypothetical protein